METRQKGLLGVILNMNVSSYPTPNEKPHSPLSVALGITSQ
jgi:hypothetical protein